MLINGERNLHVEVSVCGGDAVVAVGRRPSERTARCEGGNGT
jgi:hypothetical protein